MGVSDVLTAAVIAKFIFFPVKTLDFYPSRIETPYEDVFFKTEDGLTLHGWFFSGKKSDQTLLYLHGNAGNIGDRLDKIKILRQLGYNIFIFDYRGYGGSEGSPTIEGVLTDTYSAVRYLVEKLGISSDRIILFGESIGGAFAVDLASKDPYKAVILESTFTSLRDLAQEVYRFLPGGVAPDVYRSIDLIRKTTTPVLIIHGMEDEIVSFSQGQKLFKAAPHPKRLYAVPKAHHNDVYAVGGKEYLTQIEEFLSSVQVP